MIASKPIVAIVFAGGIAEKFAGIVPRLPKALLPVDGQPVANRVIAALEGAQVEQIFVVEDDGAELQKSLKWGPKTTFLTKPGEPESLASSFQFAIEQVALRLGESIHQRLLLFTPCDVPLASSAAYDALIVQAAHLNADIILTFIAERIIRQRFPHMRFRSVYLADLGERYTLQMAGFMNGAMIQLQAGRTMAVTLRGVDDDLLERVKTTMDVVRRHRHHNYRLPRFTEMLITRWILQRGFVLPVLRYLRSYALNRLTMPKLLEYLHMAYHVEFAYIFSQTPELSADIDRPEEYITLLGGRYK